MIKNVSDCVRPKVISNKQQQVVSTTLVPNKLKKHSSENGTFLRVAVLTELFVYNYNENLFNVSSDVHRRNH